MELQKITQFNQKKTSNGVEGENDQMGQIENQKQGNRFRPNQVIHRIKCKWSKHPNLKSNTIRMRGSMV